MKNLNVRFERFLAAARRGVPDEHRELWQGFSTRVAARWASLKPGYDLLFLWERMTRWGLAFGVAVCVAVFLFSRQSLRDRPEPSALDVLAGFTEEELF